MTSKILSFSISEIPPSYNQSISINYNLRQVSLSKEAREFKQRVKEFMPHWKPDKDSLFGITISMHYDWYYKNGKLRKLDLSNLDKLVIDAVSEKMGIDDSHIVQVYLFKIQNITNSHTDILVTILDEGL